MQAQSNILLIIADDIGADSLSLYSPADTAPTPNIDALADQGVRFTNAWANPSCTPTRGTILTGRYGFRTGLGEPGDQIQQSEFTIPNALGLAGYATACIGKWHLAGNTNGGEDNPNLMGFDHFEGSLSGAVDDYSNWVKVTNGDESVETNYATSENVDNTLSWIAAQGSNPWYCQLAFNAPHSPFHRPPNDLHSYDDLPGTAAHINNNPREYFEAMIEAMDTEIGRLLSTMDADTLANTNIIFIGDNGTPRAIVPDVVRGWKGTLYEGGVHIPFLVAGPAVSGPLNRTQDAPIHTVDLFGTVIELAGLNPEAVVPDGLIIDSRSVADYLTDANQEDYHGTTYTEAFEDPVSNNDGLALRNSEYKYLSFEASGNEELYHLASDPTESNNLLNGALSGVEEANLTSLREALDSLQNSTSNQPPLGPIDADSPVLTSWLTEPSGAYARLYPTTEAEESNASVTTWSRGQGIQELPTYAGVHEVASDDDFVYIRSTGLGFHVMGPWYNNGTLFPNYPANTAAIYRFPRKVTIPTTKTLTSNGAIGYFVDGVAMFDSRDTFSYSTRNGTDQTVGNSATVNGNGVWERDAYVTEGETFDPAFAHPAGPNYHYHANAPALRHQLGDSVSYDESTNTYTEAPNNQHSPILGWCRDGLPIYGPYSYSDPTDASSAIRRMVGGYQLRDGSRGSANLNQTSGTDTNGVPTGRTTLPQWVVRNDDAVTSANLLRSRYGPATTLTERAESYTLGRYLQDYAYKGDLNNYDLYGGTSQDGSFTDGTHYDLNEYNVRFTVTPEFPEGTYAYFSNITSDGEPAFPYNIARYYYGDPNGTNPASAAPDAIPAEATTHWEGGPEKAITEQDLQFNEATDEVTLVWSAIEGGQYAVSQSEDGAVHSWQTVGEVTSDGPSGLFSEGARSSEDGEQFYQVELSGIATFDDAGFVYDAPNPEEDSLIFIFEGGDTSPPPTGTLLLTASAPALNEGLIGYPVTLTLDQPALGGERFDFELVANTANLWEDFQPYTGYHDFLPGERSVTLHFTLVDDSVIEPDDTFFLVLSNPIGLTLAESNVILTILNDDSVLDDYGNFYGLSVPERSIAADHDGDGLAFFLEYSFNLNPTIAESPDYVPGQTYGEGEEPTGLPIITVAGDLITYTYVRRTDSYPKVTYITEACSDGVNYEPLEPTQVTTLTDHWEEVAVVLRSSEYPGPSACFVRVRVEVEDENGDGF